MARHLRPSSMLIPTPAGITPSGDMIICGDYAASVASYAMVCGSRGRGSVLYYLASRDPTVW